MGGWSWSAVASRRRKPRSGSPWAGAKDVTLVEADGELTRGDVLTDKMSYS